MGTGQFLLFLSVGKIVDETRHLHLEGETGLKMDLLRCWPIHNHVWRGKFVPDIRNEFISKYIANASNVQDPGAGINLENTESWTNQNTNHGAMVEVWRCQVSTRSSLERRCIYIYIWYINTFYISNINVFDDLSKSIWQGKSPATLKEPLKKQNNPKTSWWLNHPSEKYSSKWIMKPQGSGWIIKNIWVATTWKNSGITWSQHQWTHCFHCFGTGISIKSIRLSELKKPTIWWTQHSKKLWKQQKQRKFTKKLSK